MKYVFLLQQQAFRTAHFVSHGPFNILCMCAC